MDLPCALASWAARLWKQCTYSTVYLGMGRNAVVEFQAAQREKQRQATKKGRAKKANENNDRVNYAPVDNVVEFPAKQWICGFLQDLADWEARFASGRV